MPGPRGQWRTGKNGENWLQNHLWCPNDPHGSGIVDDDDGESMSVFGGLRQHKQPSMHHYSDKNYGDKNNQLDDSSCSIERKRTQPVLPTVFHNNNNEALISVNF